MVMFLLLPVEFSGPYNASRFTAELEYLPKTGFSLTIAGRNKNVSRKRDLHEWEG